LLDELSPLHGPSERSSHGVERHRREAAGLTENPPGRHDRLMRQGTCP